MNTEQMSVEDVLAQNGYIVISTSGYSMMPMLRDRKDTVEIHNITNKVKKYDVVLFKKKNQLVLHRVIKVTNKSYIIRGDNCIEKDAVIQDDILGILVSFTRNGKRHMVKDMSYILYSRYIVLVHPVRVLMQRIKGKMKRVLSCK